MQCATVLPGSLLFEAQLTHGGLLVIACEPGYPLTYTLLNEVAPPDDIVARHPLFPVATVRLGSVTV
ncbi:MAG: hypothetical protein JST22_00510 [Bacteroidetes bacterium]|nr:hypothetical protein [Bacteroidota bacterium]